MTVDKPDAKTATRLFFVTLLCLIAMFILGSLCFGGIALATGIASLDLEAISLDYFQRQGLRLGLFLNNTLLFTGTAIAGLWFIYRKHWPEAVRLDRGPRPGSLLLAVGLFLVSLPIVEFSAYWNLQLDLPDWAVQAEDKTDTLLNQLLHMEDPWELLLSIVTIGISAGLGEELLLRGTLQKRVVYGWLGNHHIAIWIAAAAFSAMHIEFAGFLPRLLLGAALGYTYHWTNSLWVPIGLHLTFNSVQVIYHYYTGEFNPDTLTDASPSSWLTLGALIGTIVIAWLAEKRFGALSDSFKLNAPHPTPLAETLHELPDD